jgi:hypothetical protein
VRMLVREGRIIGRVFGECPEWRHLDMSVAGA